jgi:hypothetical protein
VRNFASLLAAILCAGCSGGLGIPGLSGSSSSPPPKTCATPSSVVASAGLVSDCTASRRAPIRNRFLLPSSGGPNDLRAALRSAVAKDTAFVTIAGQDEIVMFAAPPYQSWSATQSISEPVALGLNSHADLFVGEDQPGGHLDELVPPYTAGPSQVGALSYGIGLIVDKHNNVWVIENNKVQEHSPPSYKETNTLRHRGQQLNYPQLIAALPSGELAVGRIQYVPGEGPEPGAIDIYSQEGAHHFVVQSIKGVPYPEALVVDKSGDIIAAECSRCVGAGQTNSALVMIAPPYKTVTKVLQSLSNVTLLGMSVGPNGDLFVNQNSTIVLYPEPFKVGHSLPQTAGVSALHVSGAGDLIYTNGSSIYVLKSPYTGKPQLVLTSSGLIEQIVTKN